MADGGNPFNARMVFWLIGAGIVAFAAFMLLLAYAPDFGPRSSGRPTAMSGSAIGFRGVVNLVSMNGGRSRLIQDDSELDTEDLVVVTLEPRFDFNAAGAPDDAPGDSVISLLERRGGKATLLVLPKWEVGPDPRKKGWVRALGLQDPGTVARLLPSIGAARVYQGRAPSRAAPGRGLLEGVDVPLPSPVQAISGDNIEPLLATPAGRSILARVDNGPLYILADPDLLNNLAMKDPVRARAALAILDALNATGAKTIAFDLTANDLGKSPSALKLAFEPPFLALTLAIFVAALLAGLHGAFRFGPAAREKRAIAFGKAALVENSAGLFRIAKREHRTGPAYAELIREEAAHAAAAGNLHGEALDSALDRFSSPDRPSFTELAARASSASHRYDLVGAAHALFQWKKDLIK